MGILQQTFHAVALLVHCFQIKLECGMLDLVQGKNPLSKGKNQLQTQPTCDTHSRNSTWG